MKTKKRPVRKTPKKPFPKARYEIARLIGELMVSFENGGDYDREELMRHFRQMIFGDVKMVKFDAGCFRCCLVTPDCVYKVSLQAYRDDALESEYQFIAKYLNHKTYGKYFPKTDIVSGSVKGNKYIVMVQERVTMNKPYYGSKYRKISNEAYKVARKLGINDMHDGNYGVRGMTPVFVDVDLRDGYNSTRSTSDLSSESWRSRSFSYTPCNCSMCRKERGSI